jgi:hypothetical protein
MNSSANPVVNTQEEESFFVQNVTPGHHFVTDMGIHFQPFEVRDLLTEDPALMKKSRDIQKSLMLGTLVRISRDEADQLLLIEVSLMQAEQRKEAAERQMSTVNIGDKQVIADTFDAARGGTGDKSGLVSTAGYANDHNSYSQAFQNLRQAYANNGRVLTARDFSTMTQENPDLVRNYMNVSNPGTWSGDPNRGKATFATPSMDGEARMPGQALMTNLNRDQRVAGASFNGLVAQADLLPIAEEIDITEDDGGDAYDAEDARTKKLRRKN